MKQRTMVACASATLLALFAVGPSSAADDRCPRVRLAPPRETAFPLLYHPRHDEFTLAVTYLASSLPVRSAVGLDALYAWAPLDQRVHLGIGAGATVGEWGADRRGHVTFGPAIRAAFDLVRPLGGIVDAYAFVQADALLFASAGDAIVRPGAGAGVRAARLFSVEAGFEPLISLGAPFVARDFVAGGFGIGAAVDLCSFGTWCQEATPKQTDFDWTGEFYTHVGRFTEDLPRSDRAPLCRAVSIALDGHAYPPHDRLDSTGAFLEGVRDNLTDEAMRAKVDGLLQEHKQFRRDLEASRNAARTAAQSDEVLRVHCIYSPFPVELRAYFGCADPAP